MGGIEKNCVGQILVAKASVQVRAAWHFAYAAWKDIFTLNFKDEASPVPTRENHRRCLTFRIHGISSPPARTMLCPVTEAAPSLHSQTTASATSAG